METMELDPQLSAFALPGSGGTTEDASTHPTTRSPAMTGGASSSVNLANIVNSTNTSPRPSVAQLPSNGLKNKRKFESSESPEESQAKIPRLEQPHRRELFQLCCEHPAVAQKSYGSEKRFLCPPPFIHIEGPAHNIRSQQLTMSVVAETGERAPPQKAPLDQALMSSFRFLHVAGTAKAKSFNLSLDLSEPSPSATTTATTPEEIAKEVLPGRIWASFESAPVTIISKPSKKSAKTRNIASCILEGGPVSLFNRINSQTVRTKYMAADGDAVCASSTTWSAFNVNVLRRPPGTTMGGPQPVTYGCEIVLSDARSGFTTPPLIIRKIDKGRVSLDDGGPVSQMQKVVLQRLNEDGSRTYLSANDPATPASTSATTPNSPGGSAQGSLPPLIYSPPRIHDELVDGVHVISDQVDDYLCWTIVGISKFQYTFFNPFGPDKSIPKQSLTPFPTLFTTPLYRPAQNTIELTVSNFFYEDPKSKMLAPLDVHLGNLGPLKHRVYQTNAPGPQPNGTFIPLNSPPGTSPQPEVPHYASLHTIVIVEMPSLTEILKAIDEEVAAAAAPEISQGTSDKPDSGENGALAPAHIASFPDRSLPLLFVRASDGIGYHAGRSIACDLFPAQAVDMPIQGLDTNWQSQLPDPSIGGGQWALRII